MASDEKKKPKSPGGVPGNSSVDENSVMINYKGKFSLELLYKMVYDWLTVKGYKDSNYDDSNFETSYTEVLLPGGVVKNHMIMWRAKKKYNDFFTYHINVEFQTIALGTVEEQYKGIKVKLNDGELIATVKTWYVMNTKLMYDDNISKKVYKWLHKKDHWERIEARENELFDLRIGLSDRIKFFLGLIPHNKQEKGWYPNTGYPYIVEQKPAA